VFLVDRIAGITRFIFLMQPVGRFQIDRTRKALQGLSRGCGPVSSGRKNKKWIRSVNCGRLFWRKQLSIQNEMVFHTQPGNWGSATK
jgi:hypothetical protein